MKLRLKPLRGQTYLVDGVWSVMFLEKIDRTTYVKVIFNGSTIVVPFSDMKIPIIDTKDYEKIQDTKYKGD